MNNKSIQSNTKSVPYGTKEILIPELEPYRHAGKVMHGNGTLWSPEEEGIMAKYYGYVPKKMLMKYLPGRDWGQVTGKASRMGVTHREGK